ncbi:MAG: hypothetical protein COA78_18075 [Blastopirellula sp.]|nr:MAG: hypothetical protein COA78_18075 [Blastopirellula sp.]
MNGYSPKPPCYLLKMLCAIMLAYCCSNSNSWAQENTDFEDLSQQLSTPLGFYEALGFGESYIEKLRDELPLDEEEEEALFRILSRLGKPQPYRIMQWLQFSIDWDALQTDPFASRLNYYLLTGQTERIEELPLLPELAEKYGSEHYYRVFVSVDASISSAEKKKQQQVMVCVFDIPESWKATLDDSVSEIKQPVSVAACFLKQGPPHKEQAVPYFVAKNIAWHPHSVSEELGTNAGQVLLGTHGVDIAEYESVVDRKPIRIEERESFYQTLSATSHLSSSQIQAHVVSEIGIEQMLTTPEKYRGQVVRISGVARRITKIVEDSDIAQRLGVNHYYEINLFIPLEQSIVSRIGTDDSTRKEFKNTYPIVVCSRELAPGIEEGENLHVNITVDGFFYKLWAYQSTFMSSENKQRRQVSPLLIAKRPQLVTLEDEVAVDYAVAWLLLVLVLISVCGVGAGYLFSGKSKSVRKN